MKKSIANKVFDEMIEQGVKEYEEEQANTEYEKFEFSENHQQKMNELFAEAAKKEQKIKQMRTLRKVAAIILIAFVTLGVCAPHISAWREKIEEFFMKDKEKYSLVGYGDERDRNKMITVQKDYTYDTSFLGYIPEGFEVNKYRIVNKTFLIQLTNNDYYFVFTWDGNVNRAIDTEDIIYEKERIGELEVSYQLKEGVNLYLWNYNKEVFVIYGNVERELLKSIIESVNYEKLEEVMK